MELVQENTKKLFNSKKLRIQIVSDLHTEFVGGRNNYLDFLKSDAEVLVVAGDASNFHYLETTLLYLCEMFPEVIYVAGNHDYYHSNFQMIDEIFRNLQARLDNFTWLNNSTVKIGGRRFIGATLWFEGNPMSENKLFQRYMNDFNLISGFIPDVFHKYDETVRFFEAEMEEGDIVVTHHMPSYRSVPVRFEKSLLNAFFANHLDDLIRDKKPDIWIHGHTHDPMNYNIGETQIICNPLGYPRENRKGELFEEKLIIDA